MQPKTIKCLILKFAWVVLLMGAALSAMAAETPNQENPPISQKFRQFLDSVKNEKSAENQIRMLEASLQGGGLSVEESSITHGMMGSFYFGEAISISKQLGEKTKGKPESQETAAMKQGFVDKLNKSVDEYGTALRISPSSTMAFMNYWNRGFDYELLGNFQSALQDYDQVVRLNPNYMNGHLSRALVLNRLGKLDEARKELDQASRLAPYDPDVINAKKALQSVGKAPQ